MRDDELRLLFLTPHLNCLLDRFLGFTMRRCLLEQVLRGVLQHRWTECFERQSI